MKKLLPLLSLLCFMNGLSQPLILTKAANEPVLGDSAAYYLIDTNGTNLNVAATGSTLVWNYTGIVASNSTTSYKYVDPSSVPASTNYPGCTIVQKNGPLNSYFKSVSSPSTQLEFMGMTSTSLSMNFTNTAISASYPFAYGNTVTDNFSGSFTFSVNGTANGNITVTASGSGTLNLPNNSLSDVLRVKTYQNTNFTYNGFPGNLKMTSYDFYHASQKFPVLQVQYQTLSMPFQTPTVTAVVRGSTSHFVVGLGEEAGSPAAISILYPNPADEELNIIMNEALEPDQIQVFDASGKLVKSCGFSRVIDIGSLAPGLYLVEVKTAKGPAVKKFMKQ